MCVRLGAHEKQNASFRALFQTLSCHDYWREDESDTAKTPQDAQ